MSKRRKRKVEEPVEEETEETVEETTETFETTTQTEETPIIEPEPTAEDELQTFKETIRGIAEQFPTWPGATDTTFLEREFGPAYTACLGKLKAACKQWGC